VCVLAICLLFINFIACFTSWNYLVSLKVAYVIQRALLLKCAFLAFSGFFIANTVLASQVKRLGLPLVNNFPKSSYNASTQNWALVQNSKGFIYAANNDGLLEFDGQQWNLYPIPNKSIVRSLLAVGDTIYTGAFEEFGFFAKGKSGKLTYHSLLSLLPDTLGLFEEIWKIHQVHNAIIFQSFKCLFIYKNGEIQIIEPTEKGFGYSYAVGNDIYITDYSLGLLRLSLGKTEIISNDSLFLNNELRFVLPFYNNQLLVGLVNRGLFILDGNKLLPWQSDVNKQLEDNIVFSGEKLRSGYYAFGSILNGVYIADSRGEILQHINRYKGLLNNTVLSIFEDRQGNLWLGLDNGIDYLEINSPLSVFDHNFQIGSTYTSVVHNEILYVGTNQGLFYADLQNLDNSRSEAGGFSLVPGTEGQVWHLDIIDGQLLCAHNFGCFQIIDNKAVKIAGEHGYWTFLQHNGKSDTLIAGTYNGLSVMVKQGNTWEVLWKIAGFDESSRKIVAHPPNTLWIPHGYRGIYKVNIGNDLRSALNYQLYDHSQGLPAELPYNVHMINGRLVFSTKHGFYSYEDHTGRFVPSAAINAIFKDQLAIDNIFHEETGSLWYSAFGKMGLMRLLEDGTFANISAPFNRINSLLIQSYENVYVYDSRNVFIGSQIGLFHYDPYFKKDYQRQEPVFFREVVFSGKDSMMYVFNPPITVAGSGRNEPVVTTVPFRLNSVSFRFACPSFEASGSSLFQFRLAGFDQAWSPWDPTNFKEYTNLREGRYFFEVRVQTINSTGSLPYVFEFVVLPPYYRSNRAFVIYVALFLLIVSANIMYIRRRITRARIKEKAMHDTKLLEQEMQFREKTLHAEKEIVTLRNDSLQSQINFKNRELANNTLHLINKNRILNDIKHQLLLLKDNSAATDRHAELAGLIGKINKELRNEKIHKLFDEYFDDVHQDFLNRLKEKHGKLSPRELRLCAYLKMNLTTKEIAPLMNISVRGVEIGRYRLRKKLDLAREENLINYLINF